MHSIQHCLRVFSCYFCYPYMCHNMHICLIKWSYVCSVCVHTHTFTYTYNDVSFIITHMCMCKMRITTNPTTFTTTTALSSCILVVYDSLSLSSSGICCYAASICSNMKYMKYSFQILPYMYLKNDVGSWITKRSV